MSPDLVAAMGAFLSGVAAVVGAMRSLKRVRRTERDECDKRVDEIKTIFKRGYEEGMQVEPRPRPARRRTQ